jgi:phosphate transport system substrate-binding protein
MDNRSVSRLRFIEGCIDRYADLAWRTAYVSLRNSADANELLQQAFLVAWRKADSAPQGRAWPWLAKIIVDEAQRFHRTTQAGTETLPDPAGVDAAKLEQAELAALVHIALCQLSFENRIAIVLTHLAGLSNAEAAAVLGISEFNLRARVREGLGQMLELIGDRVANLSQALHDLPIAAPSGGLVAAKAAWIATLTGATAPAVSAAAGMALACVAGLAVAALITVLVIVQPREVPPEVAQMAAVNAVPVPRAQRMLPRPEPAVLSRPRPATVPEEPPYVPPPRPPVPAPQPEPEPAPSVLRPKPEPAPEPEEQVPARMRPPDQPARGPDHTYEAVSGVTGSITSVGSDTLNNLMTLWTEGFRKHYPNVGFAIEGKGSSTGPPALIDGTADLAPMSREMKQEEIDKFEKKYGYRPSYIVVAIDALAVYVHKDNPVESLSLQQVDAIFSSTRKGGADADITTWGQLGLKDEWEGAPMTLFGRNSVSGTYGHFKEKALFKGDYKKTVKEQAGSAAVVQAVSADSNGIGYSPLGYKTAGVRAVPLSKKDGETAYEANEENCYSGTYPLSRYLYIYFNRPPGRDLPLHVQEFLRFVHSKDGQETVKKDGFIPLTQKLADEFGYAYVDE